MKKYLFVCVFTLSVALGTTLTSPAFADDTNTIAIEKLISEMADKPEHHHAIAQYYLDKAEVTKKDMLKHQNIRANYGGYGKNQYAAESMKKHCDRLIKADELMIKEYEDLAKEHEASAKKNP
jgi:hypothetical protein